MAPAALFAANAIRCPCPPRRLQSQRHSPRRLHLAAVGAAGGNFSVASRTTVHSQESLIRLPRRSDGLENVLAIGTANPPNCVLQEEYPDWFFRVTQSDHLTHAPQSQDEEICGKTEIKKRYFHYDEELIRSNPEFLDRTLPSLNARQAITATAVPELAAAAAAKAIADWGRPPSAITHLIFSTYSCTHMPGADLRLASLLGLSPSVQRTMLYFTGCNSGSAALRLAKDVAETNRGARVLVACAETSLIFFRAPTHSCSRLCWATARAPSSSAPILQEQQPPQAPAPRPTTLSIALSTQSGDQQQQDGGESEMMMEKEEECEWGAMVGLGPGLTV